jgi:hypothetical protein
VARTRKAATRAAFQRPTGTFREQRGFLASHWHVSCAPDSFMSGDSPYLIESYTLNSGMYIEITMNPTMPPTTTSITGSRIDVRDLTAAATWSS